jgi:hypothetical protein
MGRTACTEPQCLYKGALYLTVELYLYSPYGPYGLYRFSVPVQGWPLPLPFFCYYYRVPEDEAAVVCSRYGANNQLRRIILRQCRRIILKLFLKNSESCIWGFRMKVVGLTHIVYFVLCGVDWCNVCIWAGIASTAAPWSFPTYCETLCFVYQVRVVFPNDNPTGY